MPRSPQKLLGDLSLADVTRDTRSVLVTAPVDDAGDLKSKFDTTHVALVKGILEEGVHNGEFKKLNNDNIELVAYLMVSSFRGLAMPLMLTGAQCPRMDLQIDSIVDIMVEGIG